MSWPTRRRLRSESQPGDPGQGLPEGPRLRRLIQDAPPAPAGTPDAPTGFQGIIPAGNLAGLPALVLPCGFADNLPVGLQVVCSPFSEKHAAGDRQGIPGEDGLAQAASLKTPLVGRTPWSAADALVGLLASRRILIPGRQSATDADQGVRPTMLVQSPVFMPIHAGAPARNTLETRGAGHRPLGAKTAVCQDEVGRWAIQPQCRFWKQLPRTGRGGRLLVRMGFIARNRAATTNTSGHKPTCPE
jgi:hypothetical protein